jgi:hypothetical protein
MAEVERLHRVEAVTESDDTGSIEAKPVFPGVNASISVQIGDNRGIHLATMFLRDDPGEFQERCLSKIMSVTAVIGLKEKLVENKRELENAERRLRELSDNDPKAEERKAKTAELNALLSESAEFKRKDKEAFYASGRTGDYKTVGKAQTTITGYVQDIEKLRTELTNIEAELGMQRGELKRAIKNYGVSIFNIEAEIRLRREAYGE